MVGEGGFERVLEKFGGPDALNQWKTFVSEDARTTLSIPLTHSLVGLRWVQARS